MNYWLRTVLHLVVAAALIYGLGALLVQAFGLTDSVWVACNAGFAVYTASTLFDAFTRYRRQGSGLGNDAPEG